MYMNFLYHLYLCTAFAVVIQMRCISKIGVIYTYVRSDTHRCKYRRPLPVGFMHCELIFCMYIIFFVFTTLVFLVSY
jgi:hypothetical protein